MGPTWFPLDAKCEIKSCTRLSKMLLFLNYFAVQYIAIYWQYIVNSLA